MSDLIKRENAVRLCQNEGKYSLAAMMDDPEIVPSECGWIPFSKELPPKGKKVHVSTFGIVTIGERTSEADEALRLSILEPINNLYKNINPKQYQITHWQPLPKGL